MIAISRTAPNRFVKNLAHLKVDFWLAAKHGATIGYPLRRRVRTLSFRDQGPCLAGLVGSLVHAGQKSP